MLIFRTYHNPLPQEQSWMWNPLTSTWLCSLTFSVKLAVILRLKGNPLRRTIVLFFGSRKRCKGTQLMPYSRFQWLSSAGPLHQDFQWLAWKGIQKMDLQNCSSTGTTHLSIYNLSNLLPISVSIINSLWICQDIFFSVCFLRDWFFDQSLS